MLATASRIAAAAASVDVGAKLLRRPSESAVRAIDIEPHRAAEECLRL